MYWSKEREADCVYRKLKASWFAHTLRWNCPVTHINGKEEGKGRCGTT